jgi:predicted deacylase
MKHLLLIFVILSVSMSAHSAVDYYPANYDASKARFIRSASELERAYRGVQLEQIVVGSENLSIDTVFIPAQQTPRNLIILTSGNHGPEGYAGSALQELFTKEVLPSLDLHHTGILMIHALNPWGFKHDRRGTENNVNLNRNFDVSPTLFQTRNDAYDELRTLLELEGKVTNACAFPAKDLLLRMIFRKDVTQQSLTEAIGKGQYTSPLGINYGGHDFEPQTLAIIRLLARVAAPYPAIFHVDLHTGLGKKGVLHVMTKRGMNDVSTSALRKLFTGPNDSNHYALTPPEAEGFYEIFGDYANILSKLFTEPTRIIVGVTAEFGTVGNGLKGKIVTINRLIRENQGFNYGYLNSEVERSVKQKYRELFFPSDPKWRARTLANGKYLLDTVLKRFIQENP